MADLGTNSDRALSRVPPPATTTLLATHTLDSLCIELVSGRSLQLGFDGPIFSFESSKTRSIFDWYRRNMRKWAQRNTKEDVDAIVDSLVKEPPSLPATESQRANPGRVLHAKTLRCHRFAGLHQYGNPEAPPSDFELELTAPLTILEGANGSGKTSIINAITWCLSGHVYRSQRAPEVVETTIDVNVTHDLPSGTHDDDDPEAVAYDMTPITPLPSGEVLRALATKNIPLDTWVEIEFADSDGAVVGTVRRTLSRNPRGKMVVSVPDFTPLGLDPLAREIGTRMPGMLPYIHPGVGSDFGHAVTVLTGLQPLRDLVRHAQKSREKLLNDLPNERLQQIGMLRTRYENERTELSRIIESQQSLTVKAPVEFDHVTVELLSSAIETITSQIASIYSRAQKALGREVDAAVQSDLETNVGPGFGLMEDDHVDAIDAQALLSSLAGISDEAMREGRALLTRFRAEVAELESLGQNPRLASRLRLYARVARWLKEVCPDVEVHDVSRCPICDTALTGKHDAVSKKAISDHINALLRSDARHIEETLSSWKTHAITAMRAGLPEPIKRLLLLPPLEHPCDLVAEVLQKVFSAAHFRGALKTAKELAAQRLALAKAGLPTFQQPNSDATEVSPKESDEFVAFADRVLLALANAEWINANREQLRPLAKRVIGTHNQDNSEIGDISSPLNLMKGLADLLKQAEPLRTARQILERQLGLVRERDKSKGRMGEYQEAANAIAPLFMLSELVDQHVDRLVNAIAADTNAIKKTLYVPACAGSPGLCETDVGSDGVLHMHAAVDGASAAAQHISNASELRAALLAFLIALQRHVIKTRGGIGLFLLDDVQELCDSGNRRRLAETICEMGSAANNVVVTTNDRSFRLMIDGVAREKALAFIERRVSPPTRARPTLVLASVIETIHEKRQEFLKKENDHQCATEYAMSVRMFLECELVELLAESTVPFAPTATLADLVNALKSVRAQGVDAFRGGAMRQLVECPTFASSADFMRVLNQSHHREGVKYQEVRQVDGDAAHAIKLVQAAHHEYVLWLKRVPPVKETELPDPPIALVLPRVDVPVFFDIAAFAEGSTANEELEQEGVLPVDSLGPIAVYYLRSWNFGFSARAGWRAIVSLQAEARDGDLVIAMHEDTTFARRLHRHKTKPHELALSSEAEDPRKRPPTVFCDQAEVRLLPVIGVLFDESPFYSRADGEAVLDVRYRGLNGVSVAFRVRGESAEPVALNRQYVLGGKEVAASDLATCQGMIVAITCSDMSVLKRVGSTIPGASNVCHLEAVGGHGNSLLIRLSEMEDDPLKGLPLMQFARHVLGVLYDIPQPA